MSKKNFSGGLSSLLGEQQDSPKRGRPKTSTRIVDKASQEGTRENETRATFIVNEDLLEKVKAMAYWERVKIKDVLHEALLEAVNKYESINGAIKPINK